MSFTGFFEARITTHQQGSAGIDYGTVHRRMTAQGFERVIQTTAQIANEVPGLYRLHNAQLTMAQVVEMIRLALTSLGHGIAVQVMKIEEERLLNFTPSAAVPRAAAESGPDPSQSSESRVRAQSGYPTWRRPR